MRRLIRLLAVGLFVFTIALPAQEDAPVFRSDTRLVVLHATVVDRNGNLVTNLLQSAFKVYEDGVEQRLKIFRREDVPVSLGLIVDNSGSMRDKRTRVEAAALALVKASNRDDEVFIVNFNDEAFLDVEMTGDIKKLEEGLTRIDSRGGTAMRDAISMSLDHLLAKGRRDKKILFVVTDGNDNTSVISLEKLVQKVQTAEVLIYSIGLLSQEDRREAKRARRALKVITEATGGQTYFPQELAEVERLALAVAHDIRNQYILAYTPLRQELDGTYRRIRVTVEGKDRPTVRTRTGYYATAVEAPKRANPASAANR
jgi:VWFA-related protein